MFIYQFLYDRDIFKNFDYSPYLSIEKTLFKICEINMRKKNAIVKKNSVNTFPSPIEDLK